MSRFSCDRAQALALIERAVERLLGLGIPVYNHEALCNQIPAEFPLFGQDPAHRHPILLVVPTALVSLNDQLRRIDVGNRKAGYTFLDERRLTSVSAPTPAHPYLLCDVEDGAATMNMSPDQCLEQFQREGRRQRRLNKGWLLSFTTLRCSTITTFSAPGRG